MSTPRKLDATRTETKMRMARSSQLDDADRWLLAHDPQLSMTTPQALANRRIRQQHAQGGGLLEDVEAELVFPRSDETDPIVDRDRLVRLAPPGLRRLVALRAEFPSARQAELARMLGCSRQAVSKKRRRLLAYLEAMAASPGPALGSGPVATMPVYLQPDGQLAWDFAEEQ